MDTAPYVLGDGVWLLRGRPPHVFNVYVVGDVLLDAGVRHSAARILRQVRGLALRRHVLTHAHLDHMGSSHEICTALDLPLLCGAGDVATAESGGRNRLPAMPPPMRAWSRAMAGPAHGVSATLREGDELGEFTVLEVPGHSPGHLAFWRERDRLLILGDVLFNLPRLRLPLTILTEDPATNLASARRLAALEPELVCFGHGPPLRDPARFQRFVSAARVS
jgi:hydroxyacylglutathione hydrolase